MPTDGQVIKVPKSLLDRLKNRKHPGQSFAGVIEELLDELEKKEHRTDSHTEDKRDSST